MNESVDTTLQRFYTLLYWQLAAKLPRPGGIHIYSRGALIGGFKQYQRIDGYELVISEGVDYARYAMGYNEDGSKRNPSGRLEAINFRTIESCIMSTSKVVGEIGGVTVDGNSI